MKLSGKVSLITGAAQGIGKAIALTLAENGSDIAICDVNSSLLNKTAEELKTKGKKVLTFKVDVSRNGEIQQMVKSIMEKFGKIDIIVNNAAIHPVRYTIEGIPEEEWEKVLNVNLKGVFLVCKAVIGGMKKRRFGKIVNIASGAGKTGGTVAGSHYSASKAGVICFTKSLAKELGPYGINVNAIAPGRVQTEMIKTVSEEENRIFLEQTPLGRLGSPEDIAKATLFLVSDDSNFITGEILDVNGGLLMD